MPNFSMPISYSGNRKEFKKISEIKKPKLLKQIGIIG